MPNNDSTELTPPKEKKASWMQGNLPLVIGSAVLILSSGFLGYSVGHRQGLTVVGFDADAEQLVEVVQKQKTDIEALNKELNVSVQERDLAVSNANELYANMTKARDEFTLAESQSVIYREVLRQRGGVPLSVQHLAIKPLPENVFEYQLDVMQISPNKARATGTVELRLIREGEIIVVPMDDKNFNFENNERLTGRWSMPKGFKPQFIEVRLHGGRQPIIRRFSWGQGEEIQNQSAFLSEIPQTEANAN